MCHTPYFVPSITLGSVPAIATDPEIPFQGSESNKKTHFEYAFVMKTCPFSFQSSAGRA